MTGHRSRDETLRNAKYRFKSYSKLPTMLKSNSTGLRKVFQMCEVIQKKKKFSCVFEFIVNYNFIITL